VGFESQAPFIVGISRPRSVLQAIKSNFLRLIFSWIFFLYFQMILPSNLYMILRCRHCFLFPLTRLLFPFFFVPLCISYCIYLDHQLQKYISYDIYVSNSIFFFFKGLSTSLATSSSLTHSIQQFRFAAHFFQAYFLDSSRMMNWAILFVTNVDRSFFST